ncbi:MAG: 4Fe-4S dicluster domain-containing protein [Halobacteriota archaeon]
MRRRGLGRIIKESISNLRRCQTITYPSSIGRTYSHTEGLRGKPEFDNALCTGCKACVKRCSDNAIGVNETNGTRTLSIDVTRCMYCGRCAEICPVQALTMTEQFELSYDAPRGSFTTNDVALERCAGCGSSYASKRFYEEVQKRVLENVDASVKGVVAKDLEKYMRLCPQCKRRRVYELNTHTRKYY